MPDRNRDLNQARPVRGRDRLAQRHGQLLATGDVAGWHAVAAGDGGDVEPGEIEPGSVGGLLEGREPLEDHVLVVAQDQERDRHFVRDRTPQRRDPVLSRALADHAHDRALGLRELHPDRG